MCVFYLYVYTSLHFTYAYPYSHASGHVHIYVCAFVYESIRIGILVLLCSHRRCVYKCTCTFTWAGSQISIENMTNDSSHPGLAKI